MSIRDVPLQPQPAGIAGLPLHCPIVRQTRNNCLGSARLLRRVCSSVGAALPLAASAVRASDQGQHASADEQQ